jgi:3-oxoacyl-[acyl-carrier-protein] synthase II
MSAPQPEGTFNALAMRHALAEAELAPGDVDAINAHGSGTPLGDAGEAAALRIVFGERTPRVPLTATKGQHGHALGATGAWEAVLSLLAMERGIVPRVVNCDDPDPGCAVGVLAEPLLRAPRVVLSCSAGFGGINAALVFTASND